MASRIEAPSASETSPSSEAEREDPQEVDLRRTSGGPPWRRASGSVRSSPPRRRVHPAATQASAYLAGQHLPDELVGPGVAGSPPVPVPPQPSAPSSAISLLRPSSSPLALHFQGLEAIEHQWADQQQAARHQQRDDRPPAALSNASIAATISNPSPASIISHTAIRLLMATPTVSTRRRCRPAGCGVTCQSRPSSLVDGLAAQPLAPPRPTDWLRAGGATGRDSLPQAQRERGLLAVQATMSRLNPTMTDETGSHGWAHVIRG